MDTWINRMLMGCGSVAGLLFGAGRFGEGAVLVIVAVFAMALMRTQAHDEASDKH
jgi:hypothetical protein